MADSLSFRRVVRANRLSTEGKCPGCEMDYKPQLAKLEAERAELWAKNRELLGSHDVKSAVLQTIKDELSDLKALHADIIDQGRKVQIAASGESKYGAMSDSEFIEWALGKLGGGLNRC